MKFVILAVLVALVSATELQDIEIDATSNAMCTTLLKTAQTALNTAVGYNAQSLGWVDSNSLRLAMETKFAQGFYGLRDACNGLKAYKSTLGSNYGFCMDPLRLIVDDTGKATGVTILGARQYVGIIDQLEFACGGGYMIYANQGTCIGNAFTANKKMIADCLAAFTSQSTKDPTQVCIYAADMNLCYLSAFQSCGLEGQFFGCEYSRTGFAQIYPQCALDYCSELAAAPETCNSALFTTCQNTLQTTLGINVPAPWDNPSPFRTAVESFYKSQSTTGLRKVCKAFREFKNCLGGSYGACMQPAYFALKGTMVPNAYMYIKTFNQMHFICGAGFSSYLNNDACMTQTWQQNFNALITCRNLFELSSANDPKDACYYGSQMMQCYQGFFEAGCNYNSPDSAWWACEYARVDVFTKFPNCDLRCTCTFT
uniref:Secreted protein n=1 Tax=Rhabditophanes sp. KR3021 TaxID=114890 RepID=A0AC35U8V0_9BILA